jgi:hypothetical protein
MAEAHQEALEAARRKAEFWTNARKELEERHKQETMQRAQTRSYELEQRLKRATMKRAHGKISGKTSGTSDGSKSTHAKAKVETDASAKVVRSVQKSTTSSNSSTVKSSFWLGMRQQLEAQKRALPEITPYKGGSTKRSSVEAKEIVDATRYPWDLTEFPKGPPAKGSVHSYAKKLLSDVIQMLR